MKKSFLVLTLLFSFMISIDVKADSNLPVVKETEQWKIELLEPSKDKSFAQGEKGDHELYSLLVTNKGKKVYNVYVGAFRNELGTSKMYGLSPQMKSDLREKGQTFRFKNFPVKTGTDKLLLVITWEDEPMPMSNGQIANGRTYMEEVNISLSK